MRAINKLNPTVRKRWERCRGGAPWRLSLAAWSLLALLMSTAATASDPENCLLCHRYRGLARLDETGETVKLFYVNPNYYDYSLGPHARLRCTACHPRDEVAVIPHKEVSTVNCTTTCHVSDNQNYETIFTHKGLDASLQHSVHNKETLAEANALIGHPLRDDQAQCLLCHDEPSFRWEHHSWADQQASIDRCDACHAEMVPARTDYFYWHVMARTRPARSHADAARVCATCHSNQAVIEHFDTYDTTAAFLGDFHGKAMLLGDQSTAACLDCHAAEMPDPHWMLAKDDPNSPTNKANLETTCRSAACHPGAGAEIGTAAIHLDLAVGGGIEYFIGALFIVLIASTFLPSAGIKILNLAQVVLGRHDAGHHKRVQQAKRLQATAAGRRALERFTSHQRAQHWILALSFTMLCLTGFPIKFADQAWARWLIDLFGGLGSARTIHRVSGVVLLLAFAYHAVYSVIIAFIRRRQKTGRGFVKSFLLLPMVVNWTDVKEMGGLLKHLLFLSERRPQARRFSLEQKFEYFGVFWGTVLLGITGFLMWYNGWTSATIGGRALTIAYVIHGFEAFLALLHVGIVHMIGVIFEPAAFPISTAMFSEVTPPGLLAEMHGEWLEEAETKLHGGAEGGAYDV